MPISTPTFKPSGSATIVGSANIDVTNLSMPSANIEVTHSLHTGLKQLIIKARDFVDLKITLVLGESGTKYFTIPKGNCLDLEGLSIIGGVLYVQSPTASVVIEIMELY